MATLTGATLPLAACGGSDDPTVKSVAFTGMAAPLATNAAAMANTTVDSSMVVTYSDNSTRSFKLAYDKFFLTGDQVPNGSGAPPWRVRITTSTTSPYATAATPPTPTSIPTAQMACRC